MATRVGVARSLSRDAAGAGAEAARGAGAALAGAEPALVLVFATAGHDQAAVLAGVERVLGKRPLAGCSAEGVITQQGSDETSHAVAVMVVASDEIGFRTCAARGFGEDSTRAGRTLAEELLPHVEPGSLLVLFPDGVLGNCRELIAALEGALPAPPRIVGGTAGDLLEFSRTYQYIDGEVLSGAVTAVLVTGAFQAEVIVSHGCDLIGEEQTITRASGGYVDEIDGEPAWTVFKRYLADASDHLDAVQVGHLMLAERIGEPAENFDDFTVRVPMRVDAERGALYFAAGLEAGTRVQLALRNEEKVRERAVGSVRSLSARHPSADPLFVLQLDCAGRGRLLFDERCTRELIDPVQQVLGKRIPWIGLHTYGEIAPVNGRTMFHNYTSVLCAFYARRAPGR